jgi:hypothetical protein
MKTQGGIEFWQPHFNISTSLQGVLMVSDIHCFYLYNILTVSVRSHRHDCHIISVNAQEISTVACVCRINETGWTWVHFQTTPPISTFSVAVAVLDLESTSATTKGG